jgi:hypothetical protein
MSAHKKFHQRDDEKALKGLSHMIDFDNVDEN